MTLRQEFDVADIAAMIVLDVNLIARLDFGKMIQTEVIRHKDALNSIPLNLGVRESTVERGPFYRVIGFSADVIYILNA